MKTAKKKWIVLIVVLVLLAAVAGGLILCWGLIPARLTANPLYARLGIEIAETAQYLPDAAIFDSEAAQNASISLSKTLLAPNRENSQRVADGTYDLSVDADDFAAISDTLGVLDGYSAGKYLGYNIYDIKAEVLYVLKHAPYFDKWFMMPGWDEIPQKDMSYLGGYSYKITYDSDTKKLSFLSVCHSTRASFYDPETDSIVENHWFFRFNENGIGRITETNRKEETLQYSVMRIDYYFEGGDEVVECNVFDVMVDGKKIYPIRYEYLKNVRDKSVTRYQIVTSRRMGTRTWTHDTNGYGYEKNGYYSEDGYDITSDMPYGQIREFIHMNYADGKNMEIFRINQTFPTVFDSAPQKTSVVYYKQDGEGDAVFYNAGHTYAEAGKRGLVTYLDNSLTRTESVAELLAQQIDNRETNYRYVHRNNEDDSEHYEKTILTCSHYVSAALPTKCETEYTATNTSKYPQNYIPALLNATLAEFAYNLGCPEDTRTEQIAFLPEHYDDTFAYEAALDGFLEYVAKQVVDNDYLRANWDDIYAAKSKLRRSIRITEAITDGFAKTEALQNETTLENDVLTYNLTLNFSGLDTLNAGTRYRIELFAEKNSGRYRVFLAALCDAVYDGETVFTLSAQGEVDLSAFLIKKEGVYQYAVYLVAGNAENEKEFLSEAVYLKTSNAQLSDDAVFYENGFEIRYQHFAFDGDIFLAIGVTDLEAPTIILPADATVFLNEGDTFAVILEHIVMKDNDKIARISLYLTGGVIDAGTPGIDFNAPAEAGTYILIVRDTAGNTTLETFFIAFL